MPNKGVADMTLPAVAAPPAFVVNVDLPPSLQPTYGTTLTIFSDLTHQEVEVRAIHVQECADVSAGLERLGVFELHDMVMLDRAEVGVVIKVEHSSFKVLTTKNTVDTVPLGCRDLTRALR